MKKPIVLLFILAFLIISKEGYACKCPSQSIDREVGKAYDIVIGKVTSEKEEWVSCRYSEGGGSGEFLTSYLYKLQTEFSYKGKLNGTQVIQGGKYQGNCGAVFEVGKEYLIVVHKCDKGLFTFLCSDNVVLSDASAQVGFLNTYFAKDYEIKSNGDELVLLITVVAVLALALIVFGVFTSRYKRKSIV